MLGATKSGETEQIERPPKGIVEILEILIHALREFWKRSVAIKTFRFLESTIIRFCLTSNIFYISFHFRRGTAYFFQLFCV